MAARSAVLFAVLSAVLLGGPQLTAAGDEGRQPATLFKPMLVLVGDSITEFGFYDEGWGLQVARAYSRKADVLNRGFGGYTSRMGVYVLDEFLNSFGAGRIKLVTLGFGANDASLPNGASAFLHVPVEEYKANLMAMVKKLRNKGINNIVIITPPPVNDAVRAKKGLKPDKVQAVTRKYANAAINVAKSLNLNYVDLQSNIMRINNWQTAAMDEDGVHLSYTGQKAVYDSLMYVINSRLKSVSPYSLPIHMPTYIAVNKADPGSTFNSMYGYTVETDVVLPSPSPSPSPLPPASPPPSSSSSPAATKSSDSKSPDLPEAELDNSENPSSSSSGDTSSSSSSGQGASKAKDSKAKPAGQKGNASATQAAQKAAVTGTGAAKKPAGAASKDAVMATKAASPAPGSKMAQRKPMSSREGTSSKAGEGRSR